MLFGDVQIQALLSKISVPVTNMEIFILFIFGEFIQEFIIHALLETEIVRLILFNNHTHHFLTYINCPIFVDFGEQRISEYLEKNSRSTGQIKYGNSTHMKYHTRLVFSGERHNALTACATCACQIPYQVPFEIIYMFQDRTIRVIVGLLSVF